VKLRGEEASPFYPWKKRAQAEGGNNIESLQQVSAKTAKMYWEVGRRSTKVIRTLKGRGHKKKVFFNQKLRTDPISPGMQTGTHSAVRKHEGLNGVRKDQERF